MPAHRIEDIHIASPCSASWEAMEGDERVRFCAACKLNVYNLSGMTVPEINDLLRRREQRTCFRFYRRDDGTIMTRDCPVGLQAVRRDVRRGMVLAGTFVVALLVALAGSEYGRSVKSVLLEADPLQALLDWVYPPPPPFVPPPPGSRSCDMGADF